ncbi:MULTISPECIES: sulfite exporter TauE/SafE family protein [Haloferax]|uniref:Sulfite exporter TauE/SafE family protein n=2 Tax=Haloferax TaxID=2251 RepID=A0A6G1Z5E0_9EURY|nr:MULTISPECIES: sulfite exporter TauE/SafE family protein [Haloferax]KAB1188998.1 sulfite exporter TauE/SafE family protein [Haloferax sp. CBA1149]MRW81723.1 sulfite exporter TauE/SafE family protein [Haloferax marinisediminis]
MDGGMTPPALPANSPEAAAFLLVGLLGGAHCLGMCGPLVSVYADRLSDRAGTESLTLLHVRQHALFNVGRALSYAVIGALFALVGGVFFGAFDSLATIGSGVRATTGLLVGTAIILTGVGYLVGRSAALDRLTPAPVTRLFGRVSGWATARVDRLVGGPRILGLGAVHGLLPCPIIYPAYLYAFATGDPIRAAALLGLLGLGTIPTLFLYGTLLGQVSVRRRAVLHRALGAAFLVLGYIPLSHGLMLLGVSVPHLHVPFYQPLG